MDYKKCFETLALIINRMEDVRDTTDYSTWFKIAYWLRKTIEYYDKYKFQYGYTEKCIAQYMIVIKPVGKEFWKQKLLGCLPELKDKV